MYKLPRFLISGALVISTTIQLFMPATAYFDDIYSTDPNLKAIVFLRSLGIIQGYADNTFRPDQAVTRAEFAKLLVETLEVRPDNRRYRDCFTDVAREWFAPYVCYAKQAGIVRGVSPEYFMPADKVTRAEAVKMTIHAFGMQRDLLPVRDSLFKDVIPEDWFSSYMHQARFTNLMVGGEFMFPNSATTRGGSAELLYRAKMMQLLGSKAFDEALATAFMENELGLTFDDTVQTTPDTPATDEEVLEQYDIYAQVLQELQAGHPLGKDISTKDFIYGSIEGLAKESGDPYTLFLRPQDSKDFTDTLSGELVGIGVEIVEKELGALIMNVLPSSPALASGLKPGDLVTHVGETSLAGMSAQQIVRLMRGEKGTQVTITVLREGGSEADSTSETLEFTITRDRIVIPSVIATKQDTIAVLKVTQFGADTARDLRAELEKLGDETTGIILDLRNNGGGYMDAAQSIAGFFLPQNSTAFLVETADGRQEAITTIGVQMTTLPVTVLVNEYSASAAEVLAGALRDYERGVLVGEKTFGKGTMQTLITYTDGSMLRMTIAKWLTPKGTSVGDVDGTHRGLEPDIMAVDDEATEADEQLQAALATFQ